MRAVIARIIFCKVNFLTSSHNPSHQRSVYVLAETKITIASITLMNFSNHGSRAVYARDALFFVYVMCVCLMINCILLKVSHKFATTGLNYRTIYGFSRHITTMLLYLVRRNLIKVYVHRFISKNSPMALVDNFVCI